MKRVALVAERNTAVQLAFSEGVLTLDAGSGDEAQASESVEAEIDGGEITTGFNPQFLLDGLTAIDEDVVELSFTQASKPVVISGSVPSGGEDPGFRYLPMPRRLLSFRPSVVPAIGLGRHASITHTTGRRYGHRTGRSRQDGGNMRSRLRNAGHTVVGFDRNPDVSDAALLEETGRAAPSPKVVWVMVPPATRPATPCASSASCWARATWWSTAATRAGPTTRPTPPCSARRASASSTAACPAGSGASRTATP